MKVYGTNFGKVLSLESNATQAQLKVEGFPTATAIITGFGFNQQANVQFLETLRRQIYVYAFGEKMGMSRLHGVAFWEACSGGGSGIPYVLDYYKKNTVSERREPIKITVGGSGASSVVKGYLKAVDVTSNDPERGLSFFTLDLATAPYT